MGENTIKIRKIFSKTKVLKLIFVFLLIFIFQFICVDFLVINKANKYIVDKNSVPRVECIIIPGAYVYPDGRLSDILKDRVDTALEIHKENSNLKILVTGDHGNLQYDEVNNMRKYLEKKGIESSSIFLDHAGFSTYESIYRAKHIFKVNSAVIVTQDYHLKRSVYLAREMGIECYGVKADKHIYVDIVKYKLRESLAIYKDFIAVNILKPNPKFLGKEIPINTGNFKETRD